MELPLQIATELRRTDLLAQLEPQEFERVMAAARYQGLEKDQRLFTQGQRATRFYIVHSGQIKLFRLSPDGQEKIIALRAPLQSFAEAVMFMDRQVYPVNAGAVRPSAVVAIDTGVYREVLRDSVDTCFRLMGAMSVRLHALVSEIDNLCLHNATFRLVSYLLTQVPDGADETSHIRLSVPKTTLAARLSIQRETLSRLLARLRERGLVDTHGQEIVLRDIPSLRKLTDG